MAIVGGGYVGLWTAIHVKQREPACDVALLEGDICGGGASGRNGGFVLSWWPKLASLSRLFGLEEAIRIGHQSEAAIGGDRGVLPRTADRRGLPARRLAVDRDDERADGILGGGRAAVRAGRRRALPPPRPAEVAARSGSAMHRAGVFDASAAIVQPAALARGLRRVALSLGVRIYEHTKVRGFSRGRPVLLRCPEGTLRADRLVIATNAWSASLPELRRAIVVVSSDMVATAPIPDRLKRDRLGAEPVDQRFPDDGRLLSPDARRPHRLRQGRLDDCARAGGSGERFDRHPGRAAEVRADLRRTYPMLSDVAVTHDWSGPIDRTPDSLPLLGLLGGREHIAYGVGWSGNGVGPSVLGGKILASLALGRSDEWARHPLVGRRSERLPPEPVRFVGAHLVRAAVVGKERAEREGKKPSRLSVALAKLAPAGFEDKT